MTNQIAFCKNVSTCIALVNTRDRLIAPMRPAGGTNLASSRGCTGAMSNPGTRTQDRIPAPARPQGTSTKGTGKNL